MRERAPGAPRKETRPRRRVELFAARSGAASLRIDGLALHSPYDPAREAARFVESALEGENPSIVVLMGEGLGYATEALAARVPAARLIRIFYSREVYSLCPPAHQPSWHPGSPLSLAGFLRDNLGELDMEGLRPLEWQPSAAAFPSASREAHQALRQVLQELNGSLVTTLSAGRLWIRNSVENFLCLQSPVRGPACAPGRPVLIAASGPSLERALPFIQGARASIDLWALPSSVQFLRGADLRPDLVVMTDPSHWSMLHLHFADPGCPVAVPLSAARGLWRIRGARPLLLCQPSFFEQELLAGAGAAGATAPRVAPHGTVAATAIDLALASTSAPVVVAGMDMRAEDLATHCRPNAFEDLLRLHESRTTPFHSQLFIRTASQEVERTREQGRPVRHLRSLRTYAGWFVETSPRDLGRLFRLLPTSVALPRLRDLDGPSFLEIAIAGDTSGHGASPRLLADPSYPDRRARERIVADVLSRWMQEVRAGRDGLRSGGGLAALARSPLLLPLAYHVDASGLLDARRRARTGDAPGATHSAEQVMESCTGFLSALEEKIRRA